MNRFTTFVSCRNPICLVRLERFRLLAIPQSNSCLAQHDPTLTSENFPAGTDPTLFDELNNFDNEKRKTD
ncbi:Large ribosomal subunit protein [Trichinella spiralis]|uniref:Large ribosomal subunit protein n=1 Tax=Trichinella spiralis TaxID=6334 RepID=A0ABR3KUQ8_TRISP